MNKIKHKYIVFNENEIQEGRAIDMLEKLEKDGWEMCGCHSFEGIEYDRMYKCYYYFFKRKLQ